MILKTLSAILVIGMSSVVCKVPSLCEDPFIHSADRLANDTYRVYRGEYYWELVGLPDPKVKVNGPFRIWWNNMSPVNKETSIVTITAGDLKGHTYKFKGRNFWHWHSDDGAQKEGGIKGWSWVGSPPYGLTAAYSDGGLDDVRHPKIIGFHGIKVYYYDTRGKTFRTIGSSSGYTNGKNGEKFPPEVTAAMAFPSTDPNVKYYVYLFRKDKYCYRPFIGEEGCKEWRKNSDLFGCSDDSSNDSQPPPQRAQPAQEGGTNQTAPANGTNGSNHQNFILLLFVIHFIQSFI